MVSEYAGLGRIWIHPRAARDDPENKLWVTCHKTSSHVEFVFRKFPRFSQCVLHSFSFRLRKIGFLELSFGISPPYFLYIFFWYHFFEPQSLKQGDSVFVRRFLNTILLILRSRLFSIHPSLSLLITLHSDGRAFFFSIRKIFLKNVKLCFQGKSLR